LGGKGSAVKKLSSEPPRLNLKGVVGYENERAARVKNIKETEDLIKAWQEKTYLPTKRTFVDKRTGEVANVTEQNEKRRNRIVERLQNSLADAIKQLEELDKRNNRSKKLVQRRLF